MEVLMKCPATGKTGAASAQKALSQPSAALKLVDHRRQLKQQQQQQQLQKQHNGKSSTPETICCSECPPASLTPNSNGSQRQLACCSPATPGGSATPPAWEQRRQLIDYCAASSLYDQSGAYSTPPPPPPPPSAPSSQQTQPPPCCGGSASPPPAHMNGSLSDEYSQSYEYREPEENFVSIDDARIKGFLLQMSRQHFEATKKKAEEKRAAAAAAAITYEVIDLDDEEERQKLKRIKERAERDLEAKWKLAARQLEETAKRGATCNTASISLIPRRSCAPGKERIIAQIDLLDSSSSEGEEDEDDDDESESRKTMPNIYMVSCELQCDEDEQEERAERNGRAEGVLAATHGEEREEGVEYFAARRRVPLGGGKSPSSEQGEAEDDEDEEDEEEFIDEPHSGIELSCREFEHKERSFFECFLCGKKVQSSYNLRRHMMIHTGERPFACDLCERRFREFSDLKKHRRRHANEPNFVCMVCRSQPPTAGDATRCSNCDTKQSAIVASSRPQASSPDASAVAAAEGQPKEATPLAIVNASAATTKATITPVTATTTTKLYAATLKPSPPTTTANQEIAPTTTTATQPSKTTIKVVVATAPDGSAATTTTTTVSTKPSMHRASATPPPTKGGKSNGLSLLRQVTRSGQQALNLVSSFTAGNTTTTTTPSPPTPPPPPPLTPIAASHLLLDSMPPVHRPSYNQMGVVTRKEFPCPLCQRAFGTRHNLKRHFMIHTGEKPFSCPKCRKPFREYSTLKKHMVTHDRDRWYKCARCPQKFRDYLEYNEHRRSHPEGEGSHNQAMSPGAEGAESSSSSNGPSMPAKRPRRVTDASRDFIGFGEDSTDTPHEAYDEDDDEEEDAAAGEPEQVDISMDSAWLECCECGRRFTELDVYTEHLKQHAAVNQMPFECYICKKSFVHHYEMVQHMVEHDDDVIGDEDADDVVAVVGGEGKPLVKESRRYDFKLRLKGKEKERVSLRVKRRKNAYESLRSRR